MRLVLVEQQGVEGRYSDQPSQIFEWIQVQQLAVVCYKAVLNVKMIAYIVYILLFYSHSRKGVVRVLNKSLKASLTVKCNPYLKHACYIAKKLLCSIGLLFIKERLYSMIYKNLASNITSTCMRIRNAVLLFNFLNPSTHPVKHVLQICDFCLILDKQGSIMAAFAWKHTEHIYPMQNRICSFGLKI